MVPRELYDQDADPWNHDNLAGDPQYAEIMTQHRKWLPKGEAEGLGMPHLYDMPPPAGAGLPESGYRPP